MMRPLHRSRRGLAALVLALALPGVALATGTATNSAASGQNSATTAAPGLQQASRTASKPAVRKKKRGARARAVAVQPVSIDGGPKLYSRAVAVFDPTAEALLYGRRADTVLPIASITKLMTALVVVEAGQPLDAEITITTEDADGTAKSTSRLPVGTTLTRAELLQLALMASDNRAAYSLCRSYPGGYPHCIAAMRRKAAALGMTQTQILEPTGLSSNNVSTTADLSRLVRAAGAVPLIRKYSTAPSLVVPVRGRLVEFRNTDRLVLDPEFGVRVSKTGFINEAGRCLVLQVDLSGRPYVIVLLNARGPAARTADARTLRRWLETNYPPASAPVVQASVRVPGTDAVEQTASLSGVF